MNLLAAGQCTAAFILGTHRMDGQARARVCLRTATIVMNAPRSEREALRLKILLIGNYLPDAQESMRRYAELMLAGLLDAGHQVQLAQPRPFLNETRRPGNGLWKWIGYVDKYLLSPRELRRAASSADVVHICDHSNSVYVPPRSPVPRPPRSRPHPRRPGPATTPAQATPSRPGPRDGSTG